MPGPYVTNTQGSSGRRITQVTAHAAASGNRQLMGAVAATAAAPRRRQLDDGVILKATVDR